MTIQDDIDRLTLAELQIDLNVYIEQSDETLGGAAALERIRAAVSHDMPTPAEYDRENLPMFPDEFPLVRWDGEENQ
jgi:hypothetical protein